MELGRLKGLVSRLDEATGRGRPRRLSRGAPARGPRRRRCNEPGGNALGALRIARAIEMQAAGARNPVAPGPLPAKAGEPGFSASMSAPGVGAAPSGEAGGVSIIHAAGRPAR